MVNVAHFALFSEILRGSSASDVIQLQCCSVLAGAEAKVLLSCFAGDPLCC